ncbi:hypothetical protein LEP1GSC071_0588 [Leptospira santarosai str. JET]|uniref:Uncharacterized protein n=1 Tax=Leptospira santarosai str. MOR084 TaxID=1049984 RepID=A0A0E2BGZ8_9LEPT|nr:hypothetical protein LEP1GSC179_4081 [Leptospira santarosai str. MOR084]EKS07669.1 hypothetical protein LEP1GSC071_0588 [Leptospira santarosai str. JET]
MGHDCGHGYPSMEITFGSCARLYNRKFLKPVSAFPFDRKENSQNCIFIARLNGTN